MTQDDLKKYDYIPMQLKASCGCAFDHGIDIYIWKANVKKEENDALRINLAEEGEELQIEDIHFVLERYWIENNPDWTGIKACLIPSNAPSYSAKFELNGRAWIKNPPFAKKNNQIQNSQGEIVSIQYTSAYIGDILTFLQNNPEEKELAFNGLAAIINGAVELFNKKVKEKPKTKYVLLKNSTIYSNNGEGEED